MSKNVDLADNDMVRIFVTGIIAMGMLANRNRTPSLDDADGIAKEAVEYADALIAEVTKPRGEA